MFYPTFSLALIFAPVVFATNGFTKDLRAVQKQFIDANIPVNSSITFKPKVLLTLTFPQADGGNLKVKTGTQLARNLTALPPLFEIESSKPTKGAKFVIAAYDPDAPTPQAPTVAQIRHFLGADFVALEPKDDKTGVTNLSEAISPYRQPSPPAGSDAHRYIFLIYNQPAVFVPILNSTSSFRDWNISQYAIDANLGDPIGGTYFLTAPDPEVIV